MYRQRPSHAPPAITLPPPPPPPLSLQGDAEDLPFPDDQFDRYVSAGSIEYWPEPQRGICEAYRVLKPGGVACMIGGWVVSGWVWR